MQTQNQEILIIIIIGSILALLLVLFIVSILFLYQRRQQAYEKELIKIKEEYDQELLRSQLEIQEKTLKGISQDLHDNIGQMLSVIKLSVSSIQVQKDTPYYEPLNTSKTFLNKVITDLSNLTKSLHTDRIAQIGIEQAIEHEVAMLIKSGLINITLYNPTSMYQRTLDGQTSIFLFRMFQEIINNTLKHAKATHIKVSLSFTPDDIFILQIEDNGIGFNVQQKLYSANAVTGVGLKSMQNRARIIGAKFTLNSRDKEGTSVTISLPIGKQKDLNSK